MWVKRYRSDLWRGHLSARLHAVPQLPHRCRYCLIKKTLLYQQHNTVTVKALQGKMQLKKKYWALSTNQSEVLLNL